MRELKNLEDFLTHPEFIRWVTQPDKELESYWDQWRKANPEQLPSMRLAREILLRTQFGQAEPPTGMRDEVLQHVLRQRGKTVSSSSTMVEKQRQTWMGIFWHSLGQMSRVAAILLVTFGLALLVGPIGEIDIPFEEELVAEAMVLKQTGSGQKIQLTLSDGTKIWLNSSSKVEFPQKFARDKRLIQLEGEAYFEVERDSLRPFIVTTNDLSTKVLGTSFNINTKESGRTKISLVSGKVNVSSTNGQISLTPGEMLSYDNVSTSFKISGFDATQVLGWKDGVLRFQRASLREVKEGLEEWYGVEINIKNAKGVNWQFSGEYPQQMLEEVLESMSYIKDFDYHINDKIVTLTF